ncbi:MAG: glycosyltransferase [Candidatus Omnitrophica bacterium]|nr:glycosyltransferase [Candidatus Omnitrophota bacterium]
MKTLFISYNGALEPLLQSQGLAYLEGLSDKGLKFILLTFEKRNNFGNKEAISKIGEELKKSQIEWHRLCYHKKPAIISTLYDILVGIIYSAFLILKRRITVIHARSFVPAAMAYILSKAFRIKFVFDMRGMMIDEYVDAQIIKKDGLIYKLGKILEKKFLISSASTIVLTEKIKNVIKGFDYLKNRPDFSIEVIPCCVNIRRFRYDPQTKGLSRGRNLKNKFVFVYLGSVGTWYFLEGMLDFFVSAKSKIPDAHFLFLSRGNQEYIKAAILNKDLNLGDFTISEASHQEIPGYISDCDAGIAFYKQTFSRLGCSPVKFAEYLACGIPVVVNSGIGDTEEIVSLNRIGAVAKEFSENCYQQAIERLLELKSEGLPLGRRCRAVAEREFSLEGGIEKYRNIYKGL